MSRGPDDDYSRAIRAANSAPAGRGFTVLDTLGKLRAHHHGLAGHCAACAARYRRDVPPAANPPSMFAIDLDALIAERGADCRVVGLKPVPCPRCGSLETKAHLTVPPRGAAT